MATSKSSTSSKLKKRGKSSFNRAKKAEATVGGKSLPPGLENGIAVVSELSLNENKSGDPYVLLKANVVEPNEYAGLYCGQYLGLHETQYTSYEDSELECLNNLKLLGLDEEISESADIADAIDNCIAAVDAASKKKKPIHFTFSTRRRTNKNGEARIDITGVPLNGYKQSKTKTKNEHTETHEEAAEPAETPFHENTTPPVPDNIRFPSGTAVRVVNDHFGDGHDYTGIFDGDRDGEALITFDDDSSQDTVPYENVKGPLETIETEDEKASSDSTFAIGDLVTSLDDYFEDEIDYEGTVTRINENGTITVEFEEGEEDVPVEYLAPA